MASKRALQFLSAQPATRVIASRCATKPSQSHLQARTFAFSISGSCTRVPAPAIARHHKCAPSTTVQVQVQVQRRWISQSNTSSGANAEDKPSKKYTFEDVRFYLDRRPTTHIPYVPSRTLRNPLTNNPQVQALTAHPTPNKHLIDVREPSEHNAGTIPSALNIPVTSQPDALLLPPEEFADRFGFEKPPVGDEVVFFCKAGVRSRAAAKIAKTAGYERVGEYEGSWMDWSKKGGEVEKP